MHLEPPYPEGEQLPPLATVSGGNHRPEAQYDASPARRQGFPRIRLPSTPRIKTISRDGSSTGRKPGLSASPVADKSKRVRTGCLTCRERHLKCDEGLPDCNNCLKSKRECKRGLRLNFIDIQVKEPPCMAPTAEWLVKIQDESRQVASEYKGGLERYSTQSEHLGANAVRGLPLHGNSDLLLLDPSVPAPVPQPGLAAFDRGVFAFAALSDHNAVAETPSSHVELAATPGGTTTGERDYLSSEQEIQFLQVFIDEVAVWMDCLDRDKHFANVVPYLALKSPMMLNALLACGARHLTSLGAYHGGQADSYYDTATTLLLQNLQDPDHNRDECAITAVILNVCETMTDNSRQRINRSVDARLLIQDCGWDATSVGLGAACFWVNINIEVLNCISFGCQTVWDPDQWGMDLEFIQGVSRSGSHSIIGDDDTGVARLERDGVSHPALDDTPQFGDEELWVQRILYVMAKVANFHADIPQFQSPSPHDEQVRQQSRISEWNRLKAMCDAWNRNCPRSMRPYGYSPAPSTRSLFPNVWLIKRSAKLGRLFYHTALSLLAQVNPLSPPDSRENRTLQEHHAHHVCGIIAHTSDRAVASVAIRGLALASTVLANRREQNEIITVLERISRDTGWGIGKITADLRRAWGWKDTTAPPLAISNITSLPSATGDSDGKRTRMGNFEAFLSPVLPFICTNAINSAAVGASGGGTLIVSASRVARGF
ncbi:Adhesion and hyphal regulator 1 [Madurella fahalii]|uniref:Adhesion and hyphal regulator 1 n=1 Tax=Madurella fahalii TaxID=1157608 RepID=A0ABQ0GLK9_9PEZI